MLGLFRNWSRKRMLEEPFPDEWIVYLKENVPFYDAVPEDKRDEFHNQLTIFAKEKAFEGANGFEITDEVRVVIAAEAVRLTLYLDISYYDRLTEIVVYPGAYKHPEDDDGIIYGEAHTFGTVVLSWDAVIRGLKNQDDGHDTAIHEFAHVLDIADGSFDGTPVLRSRRDYRTWAEVMSHHYLDLQKRGSHRKKLLRNYGAQNEAEFFAVATEAFFEKPEQMKKRAPDLYHELQHFYGWDPVPDEEDEES